MPPMPQCHGKTDPDELPDLRWPYQASPSYCHGGPREPSCARPEALKKGLGFDRSSEGYRENESPSQRLHYMETALEPMRDSEQSEWIGKSQTTGAAIDSGGVEEGSPSPQIPQGAAGSDAYSRRVEETRNARLAFYNRQQPNKAQPETQKAAETDADQQKEQPQANDNGTGKDTESAQNKGSGLSRARVGRTRNQEQHNRDAATKRGSRHYMFGR